ncbi:hypothetical protein [Pseudosulfitobacter koreensis]|uniref:Uncharacterized protein n=1 Tax=Pseudosulfitobacter koreensis TaxID=2968472 RepID=A0ABT1YWK8_9RHOB|nr:hypothetical protein [Pseudosulfitobacter koreense]MCR8825247.1 hypothetical protein [Pseudosulfitobacter koreense]
MPRSTQPLSDDAHSAEGRLLFRKDDFSMQMTIDGDPLFWWRMEEAGTGKVRFTDFNAGGQGDNLAVACLRRLLESREVDGRVSVEFIDVVPQDLEPTQHRIQATQRIALLDRWVTAAATQMGRTSSELELFEERGKICARTKIEVPE